MLARCKGRVCFKFTTKLFQNSHQSYPSLTPFTGQALLAKPIWSGHSLRFLSTCAQKRAVGLNDACSPYDVEAMETADGAVRKTTLVPPPAPAPVQVGPPKTLSQARSYLDQRGLEYEQQADAAVSQPLNRCVMCGGLETSALDRWARFHCRRCGVAADFAAFERSLDALLSNHSPQAVNQGLASFPDEKQSGEESMVRQIFSKASPLVADLDKFCQLINDFSLERINEETLAAYDVRVLASDEQPAWLVYPFYRSDATQPASLQLSRRPDECTAESTDFDKFGGIFGLKVAEAAKGQTTVVVCDRAADALAVRQSTGLPAIALPKDCDNKYQSLIVSHLDGFERIKLWFSDRPADAKQWANLFGGRRCAVVDADNSPLHSLNDEGEWKVKWHLDKAVTTVGERFTGIMGLFDDLRDELSNHKKKMRGLSEWTRFSLLNEVFGGFRPGELTVLSGPTGRGKTTFLTEYALDLICTSDVRTLFCSFEMPNPKLLKWMLMQYAQKALMNPEFHHEHEEWLERFNREMQESVFTHTEDYSGKSVNVITQDIEQQVLRSGIQHVVVDNLQFIAGMATVEGRGSAVAFNDKLAMQDAFVAALRRLASVTQAHVSLIVHTRKELGQLTIQSLSGTARIAQEADNISIIQVPMPKAAARFNQPKEVALSPAYAQYLQVLKNRYGQKRFETDEIGMVFNPAFNSYRLEWNMESKSLAPPPTTQQR